MRRIDIDGEPYLERYFVAGYNPTAPHGGTTEPASVFLHHFLSSDRNGATHSHPWEWACSLMLAGGYREERCDAAGRLTVRDVRPGDVNLLDAQVQHRVELFEADAWTLFLVGRVVQDWAFFPACSTTTRGEGAC
jgi:hypothetical protein